MKLTGIAKESYFQWRKENGYEVTFSQSSSQGKAESFDKLYQIYENALIIDWFSTLKYKGKDFWLFVFEFYYEMRIDSLTINDINLQAIEKANELFNKLNK